MTKQTEAHLDSRRLENRKESRPYGDYVLQLSDTEAVERSPFRQTFIALGWLGLTEINIWHPLKEDGTSASDNAKWIVYGLKRIQGSELMVARHLGGVLNVTAAITGSGERELEFAFGAGHDAECDPNDLNESIWEHLETIHRSLSEGNEGRNLNRDHFRIPDETLLQ